MAFQRAASTSANRQAHIDRRQAYVDYLDTITKQFDRFYEVYKKISPVPPFPKSSLTSIYLTALRAQVLAWYDSKLASKQIPDRQPQDGIVRFMNEHREFVVLLKTAHAKAKDGPDRQMALDACLLQLTLAPVVALVVGLYKGWDGAKILEFKSLIELERAVLALAFFVPFATRGEGLAFQPTSPKQFQATLVTSWKEGRTCSEIWMLRVACYPSSTR